MACTDKKPTSDQIEYVDFLWSFFQNCYDLKDWTKWCLVSDLDIAAYLGTDASERKQRLAHNLDTAQIPLQPAMSCAIDTSLEETLSMSVAKRATTSRSCWQLIVTVFDLL